MFIVGYSIGALALFELAPTCILVSFLKLENHSIETLAFNSSGDWIAIGSPSEGRLIVYEWQSETYKMDQTSHFDSIKCLTFSPDGQHIATGGTDALVKVWSHASGLSLVKFEGHTSHITGVTFTQNGKVVLSSSLDGTVRAFDMTRFRNFKTFTSSKPSAFSCLTVDPSGEIVCAGSEDDFEICVWSMKRGILLSILTGHTGPVSSLSFSPTEPKLISTSWDKTCRIWDVYDSTAAKESIDLNSDGMLVAFRPDGKEFVVGTLNGNLTFFDSKTMTQIGCVDGRNDLGSGRREHDLITAKTLGKAKCFRTLCYTADGDHVIAAGNSKNICIYNVRHQLLVKKFEVTQNYSLDGVHDFIDKRKMTEFGNIALLEDRDDPTVIAPPGQRNKNIALRSLKPEINVTSVMFSPTGRAWAASTTEGVIIYSLDKTNVFDPFELEMDITPSSIRGRIRSEEYLRAYVMALKLGEHNLIVEVAEKIPYVDIKLVCEMLPIKYVERSLSFLATQMESSRHVEFYLLWIQTLLVIHGRQLKQKSMAVSAALRALQKSLTTRFDKLGKICDNNKYAMQFVLAQSKLVKEKKEEGEEMVIEADDEIDEVVMET